MKFTKMHGLGNDYIYLNCLESQLDDVPALARRLSQRHFGIGSDGIICICPSATGDFRMEMYNGDGSQGEMCGNGIRCVGKYLYDRGLTQKQVLQIETLAGLRTLWLHLGEENQVEEVTVHMGRGTVSPARTIQVGEWEWTGIPVQVGNPHFVLFWANLSRVPVEEVGRVLERHPSFPNRTNVEFVHVISPEQIELRVWERGSGETLACGTGAAAAFLAARSGGLCGDRVEVLLKGGTLKLSVDGDGVLLRGGATTVYEGEVEMESKAVKTGDFAAFCGEK